MIAVHSSHGMSWLPSWVIGLFSIQADRGSTWFDQFCFITLQIAHTHLQLSGTTPMCLVLVEVLLSFEWSFHCEASNYCMWRCFCFNEHAQALFIFESLCLVSVPSRYTQHGDHLDTKQMKYKWHLLNLLLFFPTAPWQHPTFTEQQLPQWVP